jgi:hypothetical protein
LIVLRSPAISLSSSMSELRSSVSFTSFCKRVREVCAVVPMCWKRIGYDSISKGEEIGRDGIVCGDM